MLPLNFGLKAFVRIVVSAAFFLGLPPPYAAITHADETIHPTWKEGRLRLELAGYSAINIGARPRSGDLSFVGSIEYEGPLTKRLTLGVKLIPAFYYNPDIPDAPDIYGLALGPELRFYSKAGEYRGFFGETGVAALATSTKFDGNSGTVNFIIDFGAGYAFRNGWHISVKFQHISNGFVASENSGADALGVGLGFRF